MVTVKDGSEPAEGGAAALDWGGLAYFNGAVVTVPSSLDFVRTLLPEPLTLDPGARGETHPILFVFGELERGGAHVAGVDWSVGARYRELGVMIPFVRHPALARPSVFPYEMFADDGMAIALGNAVYGLRKARATIDWSGPSYEVTVEGSLRFACSGSLQGPSSQSSHRLADYLGFLESAFSLPVLGRRRPGDYVCSRFHLDLGTPDATPIAAELLWSGFTTDAARHPDGLESDGALIRGMRWRTSPPEPLA